MPTKPTPNHMKPAMTNVEIAAALDCDQRRISRELARALVKFKVEFEKRGFKITDLMDSDTKWGYFLTSPAELWAGS